MNGISCVIFPQSLLVGKPERKHIRNEKRRVKGKAAGKDAEKAAGKAGAEP